MFEIGDAVIRRWNNRVYYVVAEVDHHSEYLLSTTPETPLRKCKVCDLPSNLRKASESEIKKGYGDFECV